MPESEPRQPTYDETSDLGFGGFHIPTAGPVSPNRGPEFEPYVVVRALVDTIKSTANNFDRFITAGQIVGEVASQSLRRTL